MSAEDIVHQSRIFLNAVVPLLRPIVAATPSLQRGFAAHPGVVQISCLVPDGDREGGSDRDATHLIVDDDGIQPVVGCHPAPSVELVFPSRAALVKFFTGKPALPRIRGAVANTMLTVHTVRALLRMSSLLGASSAPRDVDEQRLLVKCLFYLLSTGISQLNKAGHPRVSQWAQQPDRVYEWRVDGDEELAAHIRVKAGKSRASRGHYRRSKPFFAMVFDSPVSALGILQETDDMIEATQAGRIVMEGAPEYGATLGELMVLVGGYAT